jgi:cytochrome c oxidase assembly factor CtaG
LIEVLGSWEARPVVVTVLLGAASIYVSGWIRLRRRHPAGATPGALASYVIGLLAIALALLSPLEAFAGQLLAMHMVQHELLVMIAPPFLLLGSPVVIGLWALPSPPRRRIATVLAPGAWGRRLLSALTFMPVAWLVSMAVLWGWHVPAAYEAALQSEILHDLEHLSFFGGALLFWWPVVHPAPRVRPLSYGFRLLYVAAAVGLTMVPVMVVALFVNRVIYTHYATTARLWGLSALDDQALAWGLMGVVDGLVYGAAFLTLVMRMAFHEQRMTELQEALERRRAEAEIEQTTAVGG